MEITVTATKALPVVTTPNKGRGNGKKKIRKERKKMQAYETMDLDSMMRDIVDIFRLDGVQLVRLTGLYRRELGISNYKGLTPEQLDNIVHKLNKAGLIHYYYITVCPHCGERSYHTVKTKNVCAARKCDTCNNLYIPQHERTLFEVAQDANV